MSRGEGEVHWSRRKIRGSLKRKKDVTFQLHTIDTWETLSERKRTWKVITSRFFASNCRDLQKTAFSLNHQSDECTLLQNAPKLSYTVNAHTNLMASSVSGIGREREEWHGITSSGESSIQHPAIRNNSPGFSAIFGSQRWDEMIQMSGIEMNDWPGTTETES